MITNATELRSALHTKRFSYSTINYPFKTILESLYGCDLERLHESLGNFEKFERNNDQSTLVHKVFYSNFSKVIQPIYERFIENFISKIVSPHQFYYQLIPTFRVGLPGNVFVGEFHKDTAYNHKGYELNFNLGLSNYCGQAALKAETKPNSNEFITLECPYGEIFSFDHIDCLHGSNLNQSNETMVSFDFRLALHELYFESNASSVNLKTSFKPGSYFSSNLIN